MRKRNKKTNERLKTIMEDFDLSGAQLSGFVGLNTSRTYNRIEGITKFTRNDENALLEKISVHLKAKLDLLKRKYLIY